MNSIYWSTMAHGERLLGSPDELAELKTVAEAYDRLLQQLRQATANGDKRRAQHFTGVILNSPTAKISAVVRNTMREEGSPPIPLAELKVRARGLNPYRRVNEPVRQYFIKMSGGKERLVLNFGPDRRAVQTICADILGNRLPEFDFDYLARGKGPDRAMMRIQELIEKEGYNYVLVIDIAKCFGSVNKEGVAALLPLPAPVVNNALLVQGDVVVIPHRGAHTAPSPTLLPLTPTHPSADTVARHGLPQGALTSNLIMSRAVLGPLLNATDFAHQLVLHGDDILVVAKTETEAKDIRHALRSILENSPVGPLAIGRNSICHKSETTHFLKYAFRQDSVSLEFRIFPSGLSYVRFAERAEAKCLDGPASTAKGRVSQYRKAWPRAFPHWHTNEFSRGLLWQTAFEARQNAERRRK